MASVGQQEDELKRQARITLNQAKNAGDPLKYIQAALLCRGASGFKGFQRRFLIMDDDGSCTLSYEEFKTGLRDISVTLTDDQFRVVFKEFDSDGSGSINMTEFVTAIRPNMNPERHDLVKKCFMLMDKTGDGIITVKDLVGSYKAKFHPKYLSGEWTESRVCMEFLKSFEAEQHANGEVTFDEFVSYYASLSASIDNDAYFRLMMTNSWKHLDTAGKVF